MGGDIQRLNRDGTLGLSSKIKSGRYRLEDQCMKHLVHWPDEFCFVRENFNI